MEPLQIVALEYFGCSKEDLMKAMTTCKLLLLDDFSGGIEPVLYEFSVKTRSDYKVIEDAEDDNTQVFPVLEGQPKKYSLGVMETALAEKTDGPTRIWAFDKAVKALKTEDDSFVLSLEIMFEGEMSAPAYVVDVDHASKYITPDYVYSG